jgi:hypothetical protein
MKAGVNWIADHFKDLWSEIEEMALLDFWKTNRDVV